MGETTTGVTGLYHKHGGWVSTDAKPTVIAPDWAENEAAHDPDPWLGNTPILHALGRMAILGDLKAEQLLLALHGSTKSRERQLSNSTQRTAKNARIAVSMALAMIVIHADRVGRLCLPLGPL